MKELESQRARREDSLSLLDLVAALARRRYFIFFSTFFAGIIIVAFSIYTIKVPATSALNPLPNHFTPTVTVRLLENPGSSLSQAFQNSPIGGLAGLLGGAAAVTPTNANLAIALLRGDTLTEEVTKKMDFVERYHITKFPLYTAGKIFQGALQAHYDLLNGILTISYTDIDKNFATKVVNTTLDVLQKRFDELNLDQVDEQSAYLQGRLAAVEVDLQKAQNQLIDFMNKYGIIDLQAQSQAQASQIASINQQIQQKQIQLQTLYHYGRTDQDPSVAQLKTDIGILQRLVNNIRSGAESFNIAGIPQDRLPRISAEYLSLQNNLKIQETVYGLVRQQYETAKLQENATVKTFQVVERAMVPEVKSGPSRPKICIVFTIVIFFISVMWAFIAEYFNKAKSDPIESGKVAEIRAMLNMKRREVE